MLELGVVKCTELLSLTYLPVCFSHAFIPAQKKFGADRLNVIFTIIESSLCIPTSSLIVASGAGCLQL